MFNLDWTGIIASGDAESIWNAIYSLVRARNPIQICLRGRSQHNSPDEINSDIAQEAFLRLISGDRLTYFLGSSYTNDRIGELILNELADVLISRMGGPTTAETNNDSQMSPSGWEKLQSKRAPASKPA